MTHDSSAVEQPDAAPGRRPWRPEPVPGEPVFFLSYSRAQPLHGAQNDLDKPVYDFFMRLSGLVNESMALEDRPAGFIDRGLGGGERWSDELGFAIGHCQVLVVLLTPGYLTSDWCAREFDAFTRRRPVPNPGIPGADRRTSVLQVLWNPYALRGGSRLPKALRSVQRFTPGPRSGPAEQLYLTEGIHGLYWLDNSTSGSLEAVIWLLARSIVDAYNERWVEPQTFAVSDLRTDFGEV
ncbi:TIR domain-containing protein [Dactylosporangium sp. NPDC051541]|uniref:TIR domain-containing protein n=1 Tax=Dactylosporangium sp. NPDC051541 TaxID=3363977 RepID=UPI0037AE657E